MDDIEDEVGYATCSDTTFRPKTSTTPSYIQKNNNLNGGTKLLIKDSSTPLLSSCKNSSSHSPPLFNKNNKLNSKQLDIDEENNLDKKNGGGIY